MQAEEQRSIQESKQERKQERLPNKEGKQTKALHQGVTYLTWKRESAIRLSVLL